MTTRPLKMLVAYAKRQNARVDAVVTKATLEVATSVIRGTPVDTGHLRANWNASVGAPDLQQKSGNDKSGQRAIAKATTEALKASGNTFYLVNNLPYARVAEYGLWSRGPHATVKTTRDGFSVQAPEGMVRLSVRRFNEIVEAALRSVK